MTRLLVIGRNGQLGAELVTTLAPLGDVVAVDRVQLDLGAPAQIVKVLRELRPDIVVNAAAYTAVDKAETEMETATSINGIAPGVIAEECKRLDALLVHYSTDYVFDGRKPAPYTELDAPSPINAYGRSKLAGEESVRAAGARSLILRTSWVYSERGTNFLLTMLRLAREREELRIVADQIGTPNWSKHLAGATASLIEKNIQGLYHLSAAGETSWFGFANAIMERTQNLRDRSPRLTPITSSEYPVAAARPANSRLSSAALRRDAGIMLEDWEQGLEQCLRGLQA